MYESTANLTSRDAIRAGQKARADALQEALSLIFGRRY